MTPNVRIFATEEAALEADRELALAGYDERVLILPSAVAGREAEAVEAAVATGQLPDATRRTAAKSLREGHPVIAVRAPFGAAGDAVLILERNGQTLHSEKLRNYGLRDPAPLSDMLGLPVLTKFESSSALVNSNWTPFVGSLMRGKPAPLSSMFGMGTLTKRKRAWKSSFGLPLLSRTAAPLSSLFALPLLSRGGRGEWRSSFGFPLLTRNPSPLSNLFGIPTLIARRGHRE